MTVPRPTPSKKKTDWLRERFGEHKMSGLSRAPGRPAPWTCFHRTPCYGGLPEVLSISNKPEESPRSPGGDEIVGAPRVSFHMPRPRGSRVTSGKLLLERKVGHHEYVPSAPQ